MKNTLKLFNRTAIILALLLTMEGCANLGSRGDPRDPFEGMNRSIYSFNEAIDQSIMDNLSRFYQAITPTFIDQGITNFFSNINEIVVIINDILQFKFAQAFSDIGRLVVNSTLGIGGFFDVASDNGIPKHNEDFGQTLATWGFGAGPYLVIPMLGPSTVRDATGYVAATTLVSPLSYINNTAQYAGVLALNYVDFKADLLTAESLIAEAALDEYEFTKNAYFNYRDNLINDREDGIEDYELPDMEAEAKEAEGARSINM